MAKSKASASSATRKKHAAKHAPEAEAAPAPAQRGQKKVKVSRFAPKIKSYTPPPPPPKGAPDPVDLYLGAGALVDPELVVILRRLSKRDEATIAKGVDGLESWVRAALRDEARLGKADDDEPWKLEQRRDEVVSSMAVWAHHFPRLSLHPSRRLRLQALTLHTLLAARPSTARPSELVAQTRSALLAPLWIEQLEYVGAWCCSAFDPDRAVRNAARRGWDAVALLSPALEGAEGVEGIQLEEHAENIMTFAGSLVLPRVASVEEDDDPSVRQTQGLLAIAYLLQKVPSPLPLSEDTLAILTKPELWELVRPSEPAMLRRAMYELLGTMVERQEEDLVGSSEDGLTVIAGWVMRNCWGDDDGWAGVVAFLRRYPQAWVIADSPLIESEKSLAAQASVEEDSDDESGAEDKEREQSTPSVPVDAPVVPASSFAPSPTLALFFNHLALACTGHPQAYPTIILLLSTVPSHVLPPTGPALTLLFDSFWAAWGGRALAIGSVSTSAAATSAIEEFVIAYLECLLWQASSLDKAGETTIANELVVSSFGRMWDTYLGVGIEGEKRHKGIATQRVAIQIGSTLAKLGRSDSLFAGPWAATCESSLSVISTTRSFSFVPLSTALLAFGSSTFESIQTPVRQLCIDALRVAVAAIEQGDQATHTTSLLEFVQTVKSCTGGDSATQVTLDHLAEHHIPTLLSSPSSLAALAFLTHHLASTSPAARAAIWEAVTASALSPAVLLQLIRDVDSGVLPDDLESAELDDRVFGSLQHLLDETRGPDHQTDFEIVTRLMTRPAPFVSAKSPLECLALAASALDQLVTEALSGRPPPLAIFSPPTQVLAHYVQLAESAKEVVTSNYAVQGALALAQIAFLLPGCRLPGAESAQFAETSRIAAGAWRRLVAVGDPKLGAAALQQLGAQILDTPCHASPVELVSAAAALLATLSFTKVSLADVLPSSTTLDTLLLSLDLARPSAGIAILEPLVSQSSDLDRHTTFVSATDSAGLTAYVRAVLAILEVTARDHFWARQSVWFLPHLLLVGDFARDELAIADSTCGLFEHVEPEMLERLVGACDGLGAYVLSSIATDLPTGWHAATVNQLRGKEPINDPTTLVGVLDRLARAGREDDGVYARRAFCKVVCTTLRYTEGSVMDAERWLAFSQSLGENSQLALAIVTGVKSIILESPRFVRHQNELASTLSGIPPSAAAARGLVLLRSLLAASPPLDAPIIFLPQQRSMYLIQQMQAWLSSAVELPLGVHSSLAELFAHLAPIIQELSGSHWDMFFDVIEYNLLSADWDESDSLPGVWRACKLLEVIKGLAESNKELGGNVKTRMEESLALVRDLFVSRPDSRTRHTPRTMILDAMARLMPDLPAKLLEMGPSFDKLLHLLRDPSLPVQLSAFQLVGRIVEKHVKDLVVEVELGTTEGEDERVIELPQELVALLSTKLEADVLDRDPPELIPEASTFLLAWLTAYQFFDHASPNIKSAYLDQLRRLDLVATSLLPSIFALLSITDRTRAYDVGPYAVEDFHLELIDASTPVSLPLFAAFVYYRSLLVLPSLIRSWWESCKNRQLSNSLSTFTTRHFSPILIASELLHLRDPMDPSAKTLRDNPDFTVKVSGSNEVKAIYMVDEQFMEILVRVPESFPLFGVEVKEVRKVGVVDKVWRAWLLGVQQVITTQNGTIASALSLFKRNVTLHFEGVEACAICYSVISVLDRSLPTKDCRTCSGVFHGGCLYKWFSTSHGSSCPLCRSLF